MLNFLKLTNFKTRHAEEEKNPTMYTRVIRKP